MPAFFLRKRKRNDATLFLKALSASEITVMKKTSTAVSVICVSLWLQSCLKDKLTHTYTILEPVYKSKTEVYANIKSNAPREIKSPGKFFVYGSYIFLNEIDKGVHIIDNSDPAHPVAKAFIDIPGNLDIAVKGNTLYADMYSDLLTIDISDPLKAKFIKSLSNVFPERNYSNGFIADNTRIIVDWIRKDTTIDLQRPGNYIIYRYAPDVLAASQTAAAQVKGISGSMARFIIVNDYLYAVNSHMLQCVSVSNAEDPVIANSIAAGWDIETIYPFQNKLFLGSMGGVFIYDISQPDTPVKESDFVHARACDPVIADDKYAYVTLREGTSCGPTGNELQVINIQNLQNPYLLKTYPMTKPYGLTKDDNQLFVCDGKDGLKMYDITNPANMVLKKHISGFETYDAIAWNRNLIVVAKDGLYQYDYTNPANLVLKSKLTINR
jgi:hypothetical protein